MELTLTLSEWETISVSARFPAPTESYHSLPQLQAEAQVVLLLRGFLLLLQVHSPQRMQGEAL